MFAVFVVLSVFFGLSMVVATTATAILIAHGKLTLPHTNHRRVMRERTALTLSQIKLEQESLNMRIDDAIQLRITRAIDGPPELGTELVHQGGDYALAQTR